MNTPIDETRPCTMEAYIAALRSEGLSQGVVDASIANWLKGDFEAALRPLSGDVRKRLTSKVDVSKDDNFEPTEKTKQAIPFARDFFDNEAYRIASEFIDHGQTVSEATSIVANIMIHSAWSIASAGRIADGGIPNPERFRACVEAFIAPPPTVVAVKGGDS